MTRSRVVRLLVAGLLLALAGWGLWRLTAHPETVSQLLTELGLEKESRTGSLVASGFIEADPVTIASEYGGRVVSLAVDEGDEVVAGQLLLSLDTTLLDAQIEAAQATVAVAQARYDQLAAGVPPASLEVPRTEVARARAARNAAERAWQDAILLRDTPQELRVQIAAAYAQLQVASHQLTQAEALHDAAAVGYEMFQGAAGMFGTHRVEIASGSYEELADLLERILPPELYDRLMGGEGGTFDVGDYQVVVGGGQVTVYQVFRVGAQLEAHLLPNTYWQAGTAVNVAQAARSGAEATLSHLYAVSADPQAAQAQVDAAHSAYVSAQAGVEMAQAALETLEAGAGDQELALARLQVEQAQAALSTLETRRARMRLTAPRDGLVTHRNISPGELAAPGVSLLTLADLSQLSLTVYVPVQELGQVHLGQAVEVRVDSFPRRFPGHVVSIAEEAEFTPSAVQTKEQRVNLVFAVKIRLANADAALKPGMPADVTFVQDDHD